MIDSYSFGSITIGGSTYRSDVIIYPERVNSVWWRKEGHNLYPEDIEEIFKYEPEVLIIGQGSPGLMKVPGPTQKAIRDRGIELVVCKTEKAVKKYNDLSPSKKVVAALHLFC